MAQDAVTYKLVIIAGSAGSLDVILKIIPKLPSDQDAVFMIVVHRRNDPDSILTDLLSSRTAMKVKEVEDKEAIVPNTLYIAPADYHLLIEDQQTFSLDSSEKIHYSRPSIDVTFEAAAEIFGPAVIGVLLSGANADGAEGLSKIHQAGGYTIVQEPASAEVGYMPQQAINLSAVHKVLPAEELGPWIYKLLMKEV